MVSPGPMPPGLRANLEAQIEDLEHTKRGFGCGNYERTSKAQPCRRQDRGRATAGDVPIRRGYRHWWSRRVQCSRRRSEEEHWFADRWDTKVYLKRRELQALLKTDAREYYKQLTDAARRRPEFITVATGGLDDSLFLPYIGDTEVDHLHPRIGCGTRPGSGRICSRPAGLPLRVRAEPQADGLGANSARGIKQYKSLARVKWVKYVKDFGGGSGWTS